MRTKIVAILCSCLCAASGCRSRGAVDKLLFVEGELESVHGECLASAEKTTFRFPGRRIREHFKLDYTAGPSDTWFEIEIHCQDGASYKRRFDELRSHIVIGRL